MGMFDRLGSLTTRKLRLARPPEAATNSTSPPKLGNGGPGPYRGLDKGTQAMALAAVFRTHLDNLGIKIIPVPPTPEEGFTMGSTEYPDEQPIRKVKVSSFGLSETLITNAQYQAYLKATNQDKELDLANKADHPVVNVTWFDAIRFCNWLSIADGREAVYKINDDNTVEWDRTKRGFRLPTEAEWEYAARGNDGREYPWGNNPPDKEDKEVANYWHEGSPRTTTPVGSYPEGVGSFGHLDLAGNVWEWCYDWYAHYVASDVDNPIGSKKGDFKVLRGGSWVYYDLDYLRGACRCSDQPEFRGGDYGFRVVEDF